MELPIAFEIRLPNLTPETTSIGELAALLERIDQAFKALLRPDQAKDLVIGLTGIRRSSNILQFVATKPDLAKSAYSRFTDSIRSGTVTKLPEPARKTVEYLASFSAKRETPIELAPDTHAPPTAVITPETEFDLRVPVVRGETDIYGVVLRVGGKEPAVRLALDTGEEISCETSHQLAKDLGHRLYERVGLRGVATWDTSDWSLKSFKALEILQYTDTPIKKAFAYLAKASGPDAWADEDPDLAIAKLREE